MSRSVPEWIGKNDNERAPARVQLRVWARDNGCCKCGCGRKVMAGESWQLDHRVALINGGENRESNLQVLLTEHHKNKTAQDVAEKSAINLKRIKHIGLKKYPKRPFPGSKQSGWKRKISGEVVRREHR